VHESIFNVSVMFYLLFCCCGLQPMSVMLRVYIHTMDTKTERGIRQRWDWERRRGCRIGHSLKVPQDWLFCVFWRTKFNFVHSSHPRSVAVRWRREEKRDGT